MSARVELYRELDAVWRTNEYGNRVFVRNMLGHWRWRYVSSNGRILAASGRGYVRRIDALSGARLVLGAEIYNNGEYMERRAFNCSNVAENIEIRDLTKAKP